MTTGARAAGASAVLGAATSAAHAAALALAERGSRGTTRPNPVVGAVIARGERVLAEGFHRRAGLPHAEVNALAGLPARGARGATLYVNLEPCCHTGRTGPCTEAILAAGIARVVVGTLDPNPLVDGKGVARLRRAGVRVDVGCLPAECRAANRAFSIWAREGRPLVTLKAAASLDGFIADGRPRKRRAPAWLTGPEARRAAHELRAAHDAVLVGSGTVLADDPQLTVRLPGAPRARRRPCASCSTGGCARRPTPRCWAAPRRRSSSRPGAPPRRGRGARLRAAGAEIVELPARGALPVAAVLRALAARDLQSVLVEGGAAVHGAFIAAGLVDGVALFVAPLLLGSGVPIAAGLGRGLGRALALGALTWRRRGPDLLLTARARPRNVVL